MSALGASGIDVFPLNLGGNKPLLHPQRRPGHADREDAAAFDTLVRAREVRAIGVSDYSGARIREWLQAACRGGWSYYPHLGRTQPAVHSLATT
ncbi:MULTISPECIES: hypothetical protein [unclassified Amycolatopsis]|uniref:hypothetical protein n=1 Tax=unclassified Amycolatopsis TaxID=2618356 RepID=UPI001C6A836D|nr:hypothetical protein [Amycolatopsis sp. DSM 110486]QYN23859.1 hypothetical protein K1T34_16255 [Amycolatopsis sp. DSM 110486]